MFYDENGKRRSYVTENAIFGFFDEYRFLSNFHRCEVTVDGITYASSEAAYMAQKTHDIRIKRQFAEIDDPKDAKTLGRSISLRSDWDDFKVLAMTKVVLAKFTQNQDLKTLLLGTGDKYLEETNDWVDKIWGVDLLGQGSNMLGNILMFVRDICRIDK